MSDAEQVGHPGGRRSSHLVFPPDLVLFDCDGVLVDSERLACRTMVETLTSYGFPTTFDECWRDFTGQTAGLVRTVMEQRHRRPLDSGFEAVRESRLHEAFREELTAFDGVEDLLVALEVAGIAFCVASNGSHRRMRASLGATGLLSHFDGRVFSGVEDAPRPKPAPDLFLHAAAVVGARAERCLVVEDSTTGVAAGLAAGTTVWAAAGTYDADHLASAHRVFESMPVLARALRVAVTESAREADGMRLHGSGATRPTI
jgi:HAD superfamily hydrolase (TIGR01509 family)